uniref:TNFAIP3-interacting protein 3 n=1 Tax=Castor canadensis TaxID=51338 RepID=A0A8C0WP25_CASCN
KPGMNTESSMEHAECTQSSRKMTNSLEQKIRCLEKQRKELLEVNRQWDQQFRSMKELYERKVAELKTKLAVAERVLGTLETEPQSRRERAGQHKEKECLNEELEELKKENKLLKEKNILATKKKEHYECEIKRLNKVLQDVLKIESSSFSEDCSGQGKVECNHAEMRTEMEVLKHQPDYQWYALDQLPPDVQHKAN